MAKRKLDIVCDECGHGCTITHKHKQAICHCPFCGETVTIEEENRPLLNNLESLDDYDEEDYEDDELEDE